MYDVLRADQNPFVQIKKIPSCKSKMPSCVSNCLRANQTAFVQTPFLQVRGGTQPRPAYYTPLPVVCASFKCISLEMRPNSCKPDKPTNTTGFHEIGAFVRPRARRLLEHTRAPAGRARAGCYSKPHAHTGSNLTPILEQDDGQESRSSSCSSSSSRSSSSSTMAKVSLARSVASMTGKTVVVVVIVPWLSCHWHDRWQ